MRDTITCTLNDAESHTIIESRTRHRRHCNKSNPKHPCYELPTRATKMEARMMGHTVYISPILIIIKKKKTCWKKSTLAQWQRWWQDDRWQQWRSNKRNNSRERQLRLTRLLAVAGIVATQLKIDGAVQLREAPEDSCLRDGRSLERG